MSDAQSNNEPTSEHLFLGLANAASTTVIRVFHSLIPVLDYLEQSGVTMHRLVETSAFAQFGAPASAVFDAFLSAWSDDARYLSKLLHEQARLLDFPIEEALGQYRAAQCSVTTLEQMLDELARLDPAALDELSARLTHADGETECVND